MQQNFDKLAIAKSFDRVANSYNEYAKLQKKTGDTLWKFKPKISGKNILDAGCGTGLYSKKWLSIGNKVIALDISKKMLLKARQLKTADYYLIGDIDFLPITTSSIDLIWSNLSIQWSYSFQNVLQEFMRVAKPQGYIMFSTLIDGSLKEMKNAWKKLNRNYHTNNFTKKCTIINSCANLNTFFQYQKIVFYFSTPLDAMKSIKNVGATYLYKKNYVFLTKKRINDLKKYWAYDSFGYRLSYYIIYGLIKKK
ncbi:malonyl-ACP O-methyltransferase BioC [Candidatus Tachikawaea gelatinosa]|uniref:Malonyl-[acyl-carrier protein] O-methyltransferase n=1 Tax=Candidatus Tachikawaea gelatinosa TaxID=1410383 RepID=A0A090AJK1_9ENTR|nr:malonyl-ACP O-methyltransferase BioC [Candidatus Tachikawaea gelatinosa]BAP58623.1 malonyl-CoA O-methyltransferase BioC [Candidatus Tachikawaea gelatinosa]